MRFVNKNMKNIRIYDAYFNCFQQKNHSKNFEGILVELLAKRALLTLSINDKKNHIYKRFTKNSKN